MLAMALLPMVCQAFATASFGFLISQIYQQTLQRLIGLSLGACENQANGSVTFDQAECQLISETLIITTVQPFLHLPPNHLSHIPNRVIEIPISGFQSDWNQMQSHPLPLENTSSTTYIETYVQQLVYQVSPLYGNDLNRVRHCIHEALEETLKRYPVEAKSLSESLPITELNTAEQSPLIIPGRHNLASDPFILPNINFPYPESILRRPDELM